MSIIYSKYKQINFWKTSDLDYILIEGDKHFKTLGFTKSPFVDQFPRSVFVENQRITLEFETLLGEFVSNDIAINFIQEESLISSNGALFVIQGYTIAVINHKNKFYVFDSHSRDSMGKIVRIGSSVLLQFEDLKAIKHFIRATYESNFF